MYFQNENNFYLKFLNYFRLLIEIISKYESSKLDIIYNKKIYTLINTFIMNIKFNKKNIHFIHKL
jgi:hypothetical protein